MRRKPIPEPKLVVTRQCGHKLQKLEPVINAVMTIARCTKPFDHHRGQYGSHVHSDGVREWE